MISASEIKQRTDIVATIGRYLELKREGPNWKGKCPFHADKTSSLVVSPVRNRFKCFGCGKSGDVIDFVVFTGKTFQESITELGDPSNISALPLVPKSKPTWQPIPFTEAPKFIWHYIHGYPSKVWQYGNTGYICRFDTPDGKEVLPYCLAANGDVKKWRWMGFSKPRPLYNLDQVKSADTVIVSEGEKCADKLSELPYPSTTWIGGCQAVLSTNWQPLFGKTVYLWPDNDDVGLEAMNKIAAILKPHCKVYLVSNPPDAPNHWDVADSDWTVEHLVEYIRCNLSVV